MRGPFAVSLMLAAAACNAKPAGDVHGKKGTEFVAIMGQPVTLTAADGVKVFGALEQADHPKALILLFHQAGSSKDEYGTIAPGLAQNGFSSLAIDQRSGGALYGENQTVRALGKSADYLEARQDLQAALDWARQQHLPIVLWGSSYSSSLIFPLAADHPQGIVALLSFSPGEYFDSDKHMIRTAAAKVQVPVFIASTKSEVGDADPIMAALPKTPGNVRFVPDHGVHGSSTLIAAKNPEGAPAGWRAVLAFLNRVAPGK
jgi:alpha-beta hydrolase superfamily lysophospholipase